MDRATSRQLVFDIFRDALKAVAPEHLVRAFCKGAGPRQQEDQPPARVLALGKAALPMAQGLVGGERCQGLVVTVDSAPGEAPGAGWVVLRAGHPIPDRRGELAAREVERFVHAGASDTGERVVVLLSGGASALLPAPAAGVTLADKQAVTGALLESGASIEELNTVRKHLSRLKGGGLARLLAGRPCTVLALSDVLGDDPAVIASGPLSPDPTTFGDALSVLRKHALLELSPAVTAILRRGAEGLLAETPKPSDALFERIAYHVLAGNRAAVAAARASAESRAHGAVRVLARSAPVIGEARTAGARLAAEVFDQARAGLPLVMVSGGETTVTVRGPGVGGRSQELALGFALAAVARSKESGAPSAPRFALLSAGTDGRDGPTDAAGALVDEETLERCHQVGCDVEQELAANNAYPALAAAGGLLRTGASGTNVADLQVVAVY